MKAILCVSHPHAHCEISHLKDRIDLIGKNYVLVFYFGHHSTCSHMHSGHLGKKKAFLISRKESSAAVCLECVHYWHCSTCLVSVIPTWIFLEILPNNENKQCCTRLCEPLHRFTGHSPVLIYNLFPFSIKRCWIQLLFIVFMTTTLILFFFLFLRLRNTQRYNQVFHSI